MSRSGGTSRWMLNHIPTRISIFRFDSFGRAQLAASRLQAPSGAEYEDQRREARGDEEHREAEADGDADVALAEEAPAEAADEIDHGIEQADGAPEWRQHVYRIESPAEEGQRRDDERRNNRQLLEILRPDPDDEPEQAECD